MLTTTLSNFPARSPGARRRAGGYTLTELLVVITVIIVIILMALPLFSAFTGGRSVDGAQNIISATLQRARARAIGLQERRGVLFFRQPGSGDMVMTFVRTTDTTTTVTGMNSPLVLVDLDAEVDEVIPLPRGVGMGFFAGNTSTGTPYYAPIGLVLFDGYGRFETRPYRITSTNLLVRASGQAGGALTGASNLGLMVFDRREFEGLPAASRDDWANQSGGSGATEANQWVHENSTPMMINRYNGTLIRSE